LQTNALDVNNAKAEPFRGNLKPLYSQPPPIPLDSSICTGKRHEGNFNREQTLANLIKETSSQSNSLHVKIHTGEAYESNAIFLCEAIKFFL
jgi:hypothetical protein